MIGVNKKQAQDHYNSLIDKPFPKGFTFTHSVFVYRVTGKGTLSQSDTPQFSSWLGAAIWDVFSWHNKSRNDKPGGDYKF